MLDVHKSSASRSGHFTPPPKKKHLGPFWITDWVAAHDISKKGGEQMKLPISKTELWSFGLFKNSFLKTLCFTNSVTIIQFSKNHFTDSGNISRNASPRIRKYYISQQQRTEWSKSHNFCILCVYSSTVSFWNTVLFK